MTLLLRYWYILAIAAVAAWGGLGWYGKASSERAFADYQRQAAEVIAERLQQNSALEAQNRATAAQADAQYLKGKRDADKAFQPIRDDLATLRTLWGVRHNPADGESLPSGPDSPGSSDARACTDQPSRIIEAADRVAQDLAACAEISGQLKACREYAMGVKCGG